MGEAGVRAFSVLKAVVSGDHHKVGPHYKWVALSNTTLGVLLATMNSTSLIIALPVIFRGIQLDPLRPSNFPYLLWILMGYMLTTAVLVVSVGRLGDQFGRVRIYNAGFAVFTLGAILLSLVWAHGSAGAIELIVMRVVQGVGGAMLMANSAALLTDAFPARQLGLALGTNMVAGIAGSLLGLVAGGLLSQIGWRWVFLINVPFGLAGTVWAYLSLVDQGVRVKTRIDWSGNLTFAAGLTLFLVGITYGIRPYGHSQYGWANPFVIACLAAGVALLVAFVAVERHVAYPMFDLRLFRIRSFAAGNIAQFLAAVGRGGMQFMLIIWFQGIWLPLHGYAYKDTPLWSGIYMLPWMLGFMVMGPLSGAISDRVGARLPATLGMLVSAAAYGAMMLFPANFSYPAFAVVMLINGLAMGLFTSPNTSAIMNSLPPQYRGVGSGMRVTFGNVGMPLSMGIFFSLMVAGLNQRVPPALYHALLTHGVSQSEAAKLAALPPLGYLFAAFLGYNPFQQLLGPRILAHLSPSDAAVLTSKQFFPTLIGPAFVHGLSFVLWFAVVASLIAAAASGLRGQRYVWAEMDGRVTRAALSPGTLPSRDGAPAEGRDGAHTGARPLTSEPTSSGETLP